MKSGKKLFKYSPEYLKSSYISYYISTPYVGMNRIRLTGPAPRHLSRVRDTPGILCYLLFCSALNAYLEFQRDISRGFIFCQEIFTTVVVHNLTIRKILGKNHKLHNHYIYRLDHILQFLYI